MKVLCENEGVTLTYDTQHKVFQYAWNGVISLDSIKEAVLKTAEIIETIDSASLFFDRRNLTSYSPDAKNWVKNDFMKNDGKRLIKKIDKIAAVNSKSTFARLVSTLLIGVLRLYNRSIKYEVFEEPESAFEWVLDRKDLS